MITRGADLDAEAHGSGGTPLVAALFWGHREVADLLGRHSFAPGNLRVAAGLGNQEFLEQCFVGEKWLTSEACAGRGFYRPHSGFPDWQPSTNPQEVLDEALVWACKSGRTAVVDSLVRAGARLDADPYRGTALTWAAVCNRTDAAGWLIDQGATVDKKGTFGGLTYSQGVTALHMASQYDHLSMVELLIKRGGRIRGFRVICMTRTLSRMQDTSGRSLSSTTCVLSRRRIREHSSFDHWYVFAMLGCARNRVPGVMLIKSG